MEAEALAQAFQHEYSLTYKCTVNLEGTINTMLSYGLDLEKIREIIEDIYDNFEDNL